MDDHSDIGMMSSTTYDSSYDFLTDSQINEGVTRSTRNHSKFAGVRVLYAGLVKITSYLLFSKTR